MTNVPGAGFVALLAVMAGLVTLPLLAALSLLVARITGLRIEWSLLAVHALGLVGGVVVLSVTGPFGMESPSLPAVVGLLRFAGGVLLVGLAIAGVAAGGPIAVGAAIALLLGDVPWQRGLWYATVGYAGGGIAGSIAGLTITGRLEVAAVGAVLAAPAALCGLVFERAAVRAGRLSSAA